jgi:hypothetical protein
MRVASAHLKPGTGPELIRVFARVTKMDAHQLRSMERLHRSTTGRFRQPAHRADVLHRLRWL